MIETREVTPLRATGGARLRELRLAAGLSQGQLARKVAVEASYVAHIEAGNRDPAPTVLARLVEALGADPDEIGAAFGHIPQDIHDRLTSDPQAIRVVRDALDDAGVQA